MKRAGFRGAVAGLGVCVALGLAVLAQTTHGQTRPEHVDPIEQARHLEVMMRGGPTIGVSVRDVTADEARAARLPSPSGAYVEAVTEDGPAAEAGVRAGDVIVAFDGETVRSARQLQRVVEETPAGRQSTMTVLREGTRSELQVTPRQNVPGARARAFFLPRPEGPGRDEFVFEMPELKGLDDLRAQLGGMRRYGRLGVSVQDLTPELAAHFGATGGVIVSAVGDDSPASRAGIRVGDVITTVDGEAIDTVATLRARLWHDPQATEIVVGLVRAKQAQTVTVSLEPPPAREAPPRRRWTM